MNKLKTFVMLVVFIACVAAPKIVLAQDDAPETTTTEGEATIEVEFDVDALLDELAPLEEIRLEEPRLSTGANGELQTYLSVGETAPWRGVLLNPPAIAFIIAEYEATYARALAALQLQRQSDWNRLRLEVGRLYLRLDSQQRQHEVIVEGLRQENHRLAQIHEDYVEEQTGGFWNTDFGAVLKYGLIIIGSAAVGVVVGYVAGAVN